MALPQSRAFITSLITSLNKSSTSDIPPTTNPLKQASPADRSVLLTLHVIFPNELLSALDLLDRDLVTRLIPLSTSQVPPPDKEPPAQDTDTEQNTSLASEDQIVDRERAKNHLQNAIYYVRSAQQTTSNSRFRDPIASTTHYEVRTSSWSCSCPAFAFSAFPAKLSDYEGEGDGDNVMAGEEEQDWMVGGLSLGQDVPMCKHLLACVLAERAGMFGSYVKTREVSVEELAGWAAGWGD